LWAVRLLGVIDVSDEIWKECVQDIANLKADVSAIKGQIDVLVKSSGNLEMIIKYVVTPLIIGVLALFGIKALV
jgi:hypothetical protein